jgi:hypothetical protein
MNSLVKRILLGLIGLVLIGTACFFLFFNKKSAGNDFKLEEASVQTTTAQEETTEKVELITSDPQKELEKTLEKPNEQVTGEQADTTKKMIQVMVDALEKAPNKQSIVPDRLNHDLSSYRRDLMIIKEKMLLKYKYDASKTKVFKSNLDGTLQFTITFTDGKNILVYSGNYDTMTEQIQLATYREGE